MVKQIIPAIALIIFLGSCSSLKPLNFTSNKQVASAADVNSAGNTRTRFLDEITVTPQSNIISTESKPQQKETVASRGISVEMVPPNEQTRLISELFENRSTEIENVSAVQLKYSILLNTDVEQLDNPALLEGVDEWYGTRYRLGGTTKKGIDCSAFVGAVYLGVFGVTLPRTARDQYRTSQKISRTELQEGDLLFFNTRGTRGSVSHVGIYLQNNKFIHASVSKGVTVSDMFDPYYLRRFVGAGRIEKPSVAKISP